MGKFILIFVMLFLVAGVSGCSEEKPDENVMPSELTSDATGYYCNMTVLDHDGPKGQIKLTGQNATIWFSSARDTIAFTRLAEEAKNIAAIFVTDMSAENSWSNDGPRTWIDAKSAFYVSGSSKPGGMGAPEQVPFVSKTAAEKFMQKYGGLVATFNEIPDRAVLGPVEMGGPSNMTMQPTHKQKTIGE